MPSPNVVVIEDGTTEFNISMEEHEAAAWDVTLPNNALTFSITDVPGNALCRMSLIVNPPASGSCDYSFAENVSVPIGYPHPLSAVEPEPDDLTLFGGWGGPVLMEFVSHDARTWMGWCPGSP